MQGLKYKSDIPLLKISHASVYQFCASTWCGLCKIMLFKENGTIAARHRFERRTQSRCTSANNQNVPHLCRLFPDIVYHRRSVHKFWPGNVRWKFCQTLAKKSSITKSQKREKQRNPIFNKATILTILSEPQ